jgi:glycine hydroxymethyltransferase
MMSEIIDSWVMPGIQGGPLMHVIAAKGVAFGEALTDAFKVYTGQVIRNAQALASAMLALGYDIVSGGTDNHLMLVDLRNRSMTGKAAEIALDRAGITCNKNGVPFDDKSPLITSGIRLGSAAMTTRGMTEPDMERIAGLIHRVLSDINNEGVQKAVKDEVREFCSAFPLYPEQMASAGARPELPAEAVAS